MVTDDDNFHPSPTWKIQNLAQSVRKCSTLKNKNSSTDLPCALLRIISICSFAKISHAKHTHQLTFSYNLILWKKKKKDMITQLQAVLFIVGHECIFSNNNVLHFNWNKRPLHWFLKGEATTAPCLLPLSLCVCECVCVGPPPNTHAALCVRSCFIFSFKLWSHYGYSHHINVSQWID